MMAEKEQNKEKSIIQDPYYDECGCYSTSDGEIVLCDYHQQLEEEAEQCPYGCTIDEGCLYGSNFGELCHACPTCVDIQDTYPLCSGECGGKWKKNNLRTRHFTTR